MAVERAKEALSMMRVCVDTSNAPDTSDERQFDHLQMASFWAQIYFVEQAASEMGKQWRKDHPEVNDGQSTDNAVS